MKKSRILSLALAGALSFSLLAGCGGGGSGSANTPSGGNTPAGGTETASGSAGGTFTIGVIGPLTGGAAIYGTNVLNAAQIAVDEINALGGDIQLNLISADDVHDPETSVNAYNNLMDQGMQVLVGTVTSGPALSVVPLAYEDRVFTVTPSASGDDVIDGNDNVFLVCFTDSNQGSRSAH